MNVPQEPNSPYFQTLNHDLSQSLEIDSQTGEIVSRCLARGFENYREPIPGVFIPKDSGAYFHSSALTPEEYESWLSKDSEFADTYADWVSGVTNPLKGKYSAHPDEAYARMVLRSYLPGLTEAEEAIDPYRENTPPTLGRREPSPYCLNDKRKAVMMAHRLGVRATCRKLGIPRSTLRDWIKAEASYREDTPPTPKPAGRPRGQRPDKPCMGCGTPTRTHVDHKPLCRACYVKTEEYQRDRRQWQSDVMMLKEVVRDDRK